jgi:nucleotidyltransferase substrate binding protein (TIGR01987 family)
MDRLNERLSIARKALGTLEELLGDTTSVSKIHRDAAIQRFEYSFEAVWKAIQMYLRDQEGLESGSPKGVIRSSLQVGLLEEEAAYQAMQMTDDRNQTVHTYNEPLADAIFGRLKGHAVLMDLWIKAAEKRVSGR